MKSKIMYSFGSVTSVCNFHPLDEDESSLESFFVALECLASM